jgi:hypothetical protein
MLEALIIISLLFIISTVGWLLSVRNWRRLKWLVANGWEPGFATASYRDIYGGKCTRKLFALRAPDEGIQSYRTLHHATKRQKLLDTWSAYNVPIPKLDSSNDECPPTGGWQDDAVAETLV